MAIDSSYVRRLLPRLAVRAGIEKRVHAHGLRYAHAAELAAEGLPVNVVAGGEPERSALVEPALE